MAVLTDFFVGSLDEVEAMDCDAGPSEAGFAQVEQFTSIDNLHTARLGALLTGDENHLVDPIVAASDDPEGPFVWQFRDDAVAALARTDEGQRQELAVRWSAMEEFFGASPDEVLPVIEGLHRLAAAATGGGTHVFGWLSL